MTRRTVLALLATAAVVLGACGGSGGGRAAPPAPPAARIDPNANGTFTGPVNHARSVAGQQDQQQRQLDSHTGNG